MFYVLEFCGFGPFQHLSIPVLKISRGNAPESVKSFIESRKNSIEEDTWFPLAAAFNSCYLADSKTGKKKCWCWWLVIVMSISFPRKSKNFEKQKEFLCKRHILSVLSILFFWWGLSSLDKSVATCGIFPGFTDFVTFQNFVKKHVNVGM